MILIKLVLGTLLAGCATDRIPAPLDPRGAPPSLAGLSISGAAETALLPTPMPQRTLARLRIETSDVRGTAQLIEREAQRRRVSIAYQQVAADQQSAYSAGFSLRLPATELPSLLAWLERQKLMVTREVDVEPGRGDLAEVRREINSREATMQRLEKAIGGLAPGSQLEAERELGRTRRELAQLRETERDFLAADGRAEVEVLLLRPNRPETLAKMRLGLRASQLHLVAPKSARTQQPGFGAALTAAQSHDFSWDIDVFRPEEDGQVPTLITTLGGSAYSEYLGGGRRNWLNPLLGMRVGYGFSGDRGGVALGFELGLELYKATPWSLTWFGRSLALLGGGGPRLGSETGIFLLVPF